MNSPNIIIFEDTSLDAEKEMMSNSKKMGLDGSVTRLNRVKL